MVWNVIVESGNLDAQCQQLDAGQLSQVRDSLERLEVSPGFKFLRQIVNAEFEDYLHQLALPGTDTTVEQSATGRAYLSGLVQGLSVLTKGGYTELLAELQARVNGKLKSEDSG